MKFVLLALLLSTSTLADFVYMKESASGKTIELMSSRGKETVSQSNSLWAIYPDISADGSEVIFAEGPGNQDLHLTYRNLRSEKFHRFHHTQKGMLLHPKMTKNGKLIFYSAPGESGKNTIFFFDRKEILREQGEDHVDFTLESSRALDASEESYFPKPSADGSFVVYQRNSSGKKEIVLFDRVENKKTVLAEGMSPALSFDEQLIAFTSKKNGSWDVYVVNRFTGVETQVTSHEKDEMAPTFRPDNTIVYASNKTGNFRLYDQNGKELTGHGTAELDLYSPQFSGETNIVQGERAPYLGNPRSSFGTVTHEGKVYMCGGHQGAEHTYPPESFTNQFLVYDIKNDSWKELAPRPHLAHGFQIAAFGDYIYAFGGFAYSPDHKPRWKSLDVIDRYSIKENKWETIGKLQLPRSSNVAATIEGKVYLVGGWNATPKFENDADGFFHDSVEIFDLSTEKLTRAPYKIPTPVRRALTGVNFQNKILLVGGLGQGASHFELVKNVTQIDPLTGEVKELPPLPFATFAPAAEVLGDDLFVFGGMFKTGTWNYEYVAHIYGLDMKKGQWRHTGRSLTETKGFSQVFPIDGKTLGILGGHRYFEGYDSPVTTFETFRKK